MPKIYYDDPTQVKFWDADGYHWIGGVAYHDVIICGCCGGVFEITERSSRRYSCTDFGIALDRHQ